MSQIIQKLDQQQLKSLCGIVAHTSEGLTKSELTTLLGQCGICAVDDGSSRNQLGYTIGLNKRDWLYNCLVTEINKSQSFSKVFSFLQAVLNPAAYTSADSRQKYRYLFEETNKVLLFAGLSIDQSGRLVAVSQAETLSEVDQRVNQLKKALYDRAIHSEVQKYCVEDYLRADYYDAVFEASKGLAERVRQISGLTTDCIEKFNQHSEQQIREVIVICRPKDCPNQIRTSGLSLYLGSIDHQNVRYYFWNIYEWVVSMLQKMPDEGKEFFLRSLNCYINDANTSEAVKIEWRKLHNIE